MNSLEAETYSVFEAGGDAEFSVLETGGNLSEEYVTIGEICVASIDGAERPNLCCGQEFLIDS